MTASESPLHGISSRRSRSLQLTDQSGRLHVEVEPAPWFHDGERRLREAAALGHLHLVVGDYTEPGVSDQEGRCANAALIEVDLIGGRVRAISSLVGLPPIVLQKTGQFSALSCPFMPGGRMAGVADIEGIADALRWGHPLDGRTIFRDLHIVPPHSAVTLEVGREPVIEPQHLTASLHRDEMLNQEQLVEAQIEAMLAAASRLPSADAFLSLSGGLDSRTVSVALLGIGRRVPCVSMAGSQYSLDARLARRFCETHDLRHEVIEFGDDYIKRLPDLALQSAALTGGVACLSQTIDLYMYSQLDSAAHIRISGHLGNQVGRGGVESIAAAGLSAEIFSRDLRLALERRPREPWFVARMAEARYARVLFEQEVHFWSIANYMLGSSRALQLSPYADVTLIELAMATISRDARFRNPTKVSIRRRDMRHRLFGPPRRQSFQRTILTRYAGLHNDVPINWGWRARGGWSVRWSAAALRAATDAVACKLGRQYAPLKGPMMYVSRVLGRPSSLVAWPEMLQGPLRALTYDILLSKEILESGLFEIDRLRQALDEHFQGRANHHAAIFRAMEIALGLVSRKVSVHPYGA